MDSIYEWNDEFREALEAVEADLDRTLLVAPWDSSADAEDNRTVKLLLYGPRLRSSYTMAAIDVDGQPYDIIVPSTPPASPIYVDDVLIGEVRPYTVYTYHAIQYRFPTEAVIVAICDALRLCCDEEFLATEYERIRDQEHEALAAYLKTAHERQLVNRRETIAGWQHEVIGYQDRIVEAMCQIREEQDLLDALLIVQSNNSGDQVLREWERLQAHPRVSQCRFRNEQLVITTTDDLRLHREDTNDSRWLGAFEISFNPQTFTIYMTNLNTRRGGRDHPHVVDNRPCFGGHQETFTELLSRGELYTVFELLLQYIETLNLADEYGRFGSYWFDVPDERPVEEAVAA